MAGNAVTTDPGLFPIFKEWYDDRKMAEVLWRASPVLREMQMTRIGGKTYNFTANYAAGGAASGSALVASANAANGQGKNVQFAVTPGRLFSIFNINPQEIFASENVRGAFVPVPVIRMGDGLAWICRNRSNQASHLAQPLWRGRDRSSQMHRKPMNSPDAARRRNPCLVPFPRARAQRCPALRARSSTAECGRAARSESSAAATERGSAEPTRPRGGPSCR